MSIDQKYCKTLELHKILEELTAFAGCEAAKEQIMQIRPQTNLRVVREELLRTNDAFELSAKFGTPSFFNLKDPSALLQLADAGGLLTLRAFLQLAEVLRQVRLLVEWHRQCASMTHGLQELFEALCPNQSLEKRIGAVVVNEEQVDDFASLELADIRRKMRAKQVEAKRAIERITRSNKYQKMLQDNLVTMRDGRFVIPVKAEYRTEVPGLVHDTSGSGATLFIEPMAVVDANNEIRVLETQERAEIERILYELGALCASHRAEITQNFQIIVALNIYFAKSNLAAKMRAQMPAMVEDGSVILKEARHPLIDPKKVVPISVELGSSYRTLVVTGPNTGGKTVTLKTIGLLSLMAMCGLLVPARAGTTLSVFDQILVDIGDEQSIEQSLSTFSGHMTNIVSILQRANAKSLVLMDELGSGTDPIEGAAIAIAILEQLKAQGCVIASTTHYPELKLYAIETPQVENACCEFDVKTLQPTYKLLIGVPGRSNAFAISRKLGLPEEVLAEADRLLSHQDKSLEGVIQRLEDARQAFEDQKATANQQKNHYQKKLREVEQAREELQKQQEQVLEQAREQARKLVEQVKFDAELLMEELDDLRKQKEHEEFSKRTALARGQLRGQLDDLHRQANPVTERKNDGYKLPRKLKVGDSVHLVDIDKPAVVLELPDRSGMVSVQAGIMKMRVKQDTLRLVEQKNPYKPKGKVLRSVRSNAERTGQSELDLRGKMVEEALMEVDFFIDRAMLSHLDNVTIIHGKGTGALRKAVQEHLKRHKGVKSYRLGVFGEGESGVTIATLK